MATLFLARGIHRRAWPRGQRRDGGGDRRPGVPAALELGLEWFDGFVGIVVHEDAVIATRVEDDDGIVHAYDEELSGER